MALEKFYRSTGSSGLRAELQWKAVLAMNAYYKTGGNVSAKKGEMQAVIDRLQAETSKYTMPHFTDEERQAAVRKYGGAVMLEPLPDTHERSKISTTSPLLLVGIAILALWYLLLGRQKG